MSNKNFCNSPGPGELFCQREAGHDRQCAAQNIDAFLGVEVWDNPSDEREKAVRDVIKAWIVEGPAPKFHRMKQQELKAEWPTLYWSVRRLAKVDKAVFVKDYTGKEGTNE